MACMDSPEPNVINVWMNCYTLSALKGMDLLTLMNFLVDSNNGLLWPEH
uniref:Uncharacterized protein n=1 Tax=Candidatus Nitrotoga fabula TaxID=2182327 RepID=A0A2X0QW89_9PROT|nr:protein of unknown function [Candidatus Nitrotoga fabula]